MNGHSSFNGAESKPGRLVLLVFEDAYTAMLILQWTVNFLWLQKVQHQLSTSKLKTCTR